jgi:hypothetical protein
MAIAYGCQVPLFGREREHHILVGAPDSSLGVGRHSYVQLEVTAARGSVSMPTLEVARTSYKFGCGSVSQSLDRNRVCLRYALTFLFSLCIFCTKCLANILEFYF